VKIALVAAEAGPYAKVGGLADVIGALPGALAQEGAEPSVILPGHKVLLEKLKSEPLPGEFAVPVGTETEPFKVRRARTANGASLYLIDHPGYFGSRNGVYGEGGKDYADNLRRFILFGRAAAVTAAELIRPDVLHAHDWHASVAPIVIRADQSLRQSFAGTVSIFTIHNLAFQGICEASDFSLLNLDPSYFSIDFLEFYGRINLMKGAVLLADGASTVSPSYAREISTDPELGFAMEGVLRARGDRFVGILNGADYNEWNPAHDKLIAARYTPAKRKGKKVCTRALRESLGLPQYDDVPVVGMVTRMTSQKGTDLLAKALETVMALDLQLVMLASGDSELEKLFKAAEQRHPERLRVVTAFDNTLAHRIQAGSHLFLMPSRFEPCGLTQMYALKYGTAPVVRATGGLRDTVTEFDPKLATGNGFVFEEYAAPALVGALERACATFRNQRLWQRLTTNCFAADFSWRRTARQYLDWFESLRRERGQG
jgi:starch synthase